MDQTRDPGPNKKPLPQSLCSPSLPVSNALLSDGCDLLLTVKREAVLYASGRPLGPARAIPLCIRLEDPRIPAQGALAGSRRVSEAAGLPQRQRGQAGRHLPVRGHPPRMNTH
jgi:hypothetical protein